MGRKMSVRPSVSPSVHPSTRSFFDFSEIWYVGRGWWKSWTQTQVTTRSIPHCQCWIDNLSDLLSLQYKENKGKFAASNGRLKAKSFSALPPDSLTRGSAPGPRWGSAPDPHYRLALPHSTWAPSLWPPLFFTFRGLWQKWSIVSKFP